MPDTFFSSTLLASTNKLSVNIMVDSLVVGTSVASVLNSHFFLFSTDFFLSEAQCKKFSESVFRYINVKI